MGNTASGDTGRHRYGYHVLRVKDHSPASQAGLRPFFDYIMAVNGIRLNTESTTLREQMEASEDKPMVLDVYSTREQELRKVEMTPTLKWGDGTEGLVGCSVRFCLFNTINDIVWHILDIAQNSPAELAGLRAYTDYVIGTPLGVMRGEGDLYDLVEDYIGEPMPLHVYNEEVNEVREVVITPSDEWGGEGLLGCDVGYGYLHRLPKDLVHLQEANESQSRTGEQRADPKSLVPKANEESAAALPVAEKQYSESSAHTVVPNAPPEREEHIHDTVQPPVVRDSSRHEMTEYAHVEHELTAQAPVYPHTTPAEGRHDVSQVTKINTLGSPLQIPDSIFRPQVETLHQQEVHATDNIPLPSKETPSMEAEHASPSQGSEQAPLFREEDQVTPESGAEFKHQAQTERYDPGQLQQRQQDRQDKEDTRNHQQELQNANTDVSEYVLEGMIRNMSLGASVFPL